jgi:hypothetical protein
MNSVPWSCRESFTADNCGLPGPNCGCWRYRQIADDDGLKRLTHRGIPPKHVATSVVAWLMFERNVDGSKLSTKFVNTSAPPPPSGPTNYQVLFGFDKEGVRSRPPTSTPIPTLIIYRKGSLETDVTGWKEALATYFDRDTFKPMIVSELNGISLSIADLLNAYMDGNCTYRQRGILGITQCKLEVEFAQQNLTGSRLVTFSYIDPVRLTVEQVPVPPLGDEALLTPLSVREALAHCKRLEIDSPPGQNVLRKITFPDCFTPYGRYHILPSEVESSFLHFPLGEVDTYLLHWLLLRVLADRRNAEFFQCLQRWRAQLQSNDVEVRRRLFRQMLAAQVKLDNDGHVFEDSVLANICHEDLAKYLGIYLRPTPFDVVLQTIELGPNNRIDVARAAVDFLNQQFDTAHKAIRPYSRLPMYKDLGWHRSPLLETQTDDCTEWSRERLLEGILASLVNGAGIAEDHNPDVAAKLQLDQLLDKCVFPVGHFLTHWPCDLGMTDYFILPLWEETIQSVLRPVVFAHVFAQSLTQKEAAEEGKKMQAMLRPFGEAIAHSIYDRMSTAWTESDADVKLVGVLAHMAGNRLTLVNLGPAQKLIHTIAQTGTPRDGGLGELEIGAAARNLDLSKSALDAARCLIGLNELSATGGRLRAKFLTEEPYSFSECFQSAKGMLEAMRRRDRNIPRTPSSPPGLAKIAFEVNDDNSGRLRNIFFPKGYLLPAYIETFLYEILSNASRHGRRRESVHGDIEVRVAIAVDIRNDEVAFTFANPLNTDISGPGHWVMDGQIAIPEYRQHYEYHRHNFLSLTKELTRRIQGVQFESMVYPREHGSKEWFYSITLRLGALLVEGSAERVSSYVSTGISLS